MRTSALLSAVLMLSLSESALAQEWVEYINREDGFRVDFPGQPRAGHDLDVGVWLHITCPYLRCEPRSGALF